MLKLFGTNRHRSGQARVRAISAMSPLENEMRWNKCPNRLTSKEYTRPTQSVPNAQLEASLGEPLAPHLFGSIRWHTLSRLNTDYASPTEQIGDIRT